MHRRHLLSLLALAPIASATSVSTSVISPQQAWKYMQKHPEAIVIDVRTPEEFQSGHIPGAINLPLAAIVSGNIPVTFSDKGRTYLVYCRSGRRSAAAVRLLSSLGYRSLYDFGGILDWPYDIVR
ncbi:MAG TPA: rhodanese-like domain-containing protein [Sutterella sp.]|nr:rhodanese-like domain-containing protein [Sutterella sp.]